MFGFQSSGILLNVGVCDRYEGDESAYASHVGISSLKLTMEVHLWANNVEM